MVLCTECGFENNDAKEVCAKCGASLSSSTEFENSADELPIDSPPTPDMVHYTLPLSISASDAHMILFTWLEKQYGENFKREEFNVLRMNKKYYGCWLFWYSVLDEGNTSSIKEITGETGKRKKIIIINGNEDFPVEISELSAYYGFMDMCILDNKILTSPEYVTITKSEKAADIEALDILKREEPQLFKNDDIISSRAKLLHRLPIGLPVWEGAYDFKGGKGCLFFINGQNGNIVGEEFPSDKKDTPIKIIPFAILIFIALILLLLFLFFTSENKDSEQNNEIRNSPTPSAAYSTTPLISPDAKSISPSNAPSHIVPLNPTLNSNSASTDKDIAINVVLDNFKAIQEKDFDKVYNLRTERIRKTKDPSFYKELYSDNVMVSVLEARAISCNNNEAHISVTLSSKDVISGIKREGTYEGWFFLKKEGNDWRIEDSGLKLVPNSRENIHQ